ncbi:MAG: ribonuclease E/G, partial [Methylobacter sp.]|nr:ribonuclease E/G [Methylobacter sp.]
MKRGTEKVIAHLPIECAAFLLNEKRSVIQQIESRLKVDIIVLPSKHLETPAYDIERIKEKETAEEKRSSYSQIKSEEISIPEFAQQIKHNSEKPAIKEFLHDSPVPVQNKNESASLIKRFWQKLIGSTAAIEVTEPVRAVEPEKPAAISTQQQRHNKPRNEQNRNRGRDRDRNRERDNTQQAKPKPEQNQEAAPVNRPPRGPGRNVKPNIPPTAILPLANPEPVIPELFDDSLIFGELPDTATETTEQPRKANRNNNRRGPNRRRPRNPNYKKPETEGGSSDSQEHSADSSSAPDQVISHDTNQSVDAPERRPEPQVTQPKQDTDSHQESPREQPAPKPVSEPAPVVVVEATRSDSVSDS